MKSFFSASILLAISLLSTSIIADPKPLTSEQVDAQMRQMADNINKQLPRKVDDVLTLEKIEYSDKVFSYYYKIDDLNKLQYLPSIERDTNKTTCKTMEKIINEQGFSYYYNYVAPNNERLLDFVINKESCNKIK